MAIDNQLCNLNPTEQFAELLAASQRRLYLYIRTLVHRSEDAEEVLSNTNLILWAKFDEFRQGSNFQAWACQIARYEVLKFRQIKKRRLRKSWVGLSDEVLEMVAKTFAEKADRLEARHGALDECLKKFGNAIAICSIAVTDREPQWLKLLKRLADRPKGSTKFSNVFIVLLRNVLRTIARERDS